MREPIESWRAGTGGEKKWKETKIERMDRRTPRGGAGFGEGGEGGLGCQMMKSGEEKLLSNSKRNQKYADFSFLSRKSEAFLVLAPFSTGTLEQSIPCRFAQRVLHTYLRPLA